MAKKKHYVYLSARKMDYNQVPEGFAVFNVFSHAKTVVCGQVMSSGFGLLSYDQPLSKAVMDDYALTDISGLPRPFLNDLGAFL
ncbi:hypothetical protein [Lactobacillus delbrueckii]|uniref:hypothetical protein n=1 Tax=Lactobacillus delbrueckii TaxID=1584 RepID=UPI00177FCB0A|nr:hypothetical protein [Lactobacillus delbrueckii]MBD5834727.1 hypothetical protein [Lactobacillus delbrueckii]